MEFIQNVFSIFQNAFTVRKSDFKSQKFHLETSVLSWKQDYSLGNISIILET